MASIWPAAPSAACTRVPKPRMAIRRPSRRTSPLPSGTVARPSPTAAPHPAPRG
ncbi:Uncharacterised protein [Bordetella pertussis]|nr:Uncharacterised protein [Bordetella pertussis]